MFMSPPPFCGESDVTASARNVVRLPFSTTLCITTNYYAYDVLKYSWCELINVRMSANA